MTKTIGMIFIVLGLVGLRDNLVQVVGGFLTEGEGRSSMLILLIILVLLFGVGGGYYGHRRQEVEKQ